MYIRRNTQSHPHQADRTRPPHAACGAAGISGHPASRVAPLALISAPAPAPQLVVPALGRSKSVRPAARLHLPSTRQGRPGVWCGDPTQTERARCKIRTIPSMGTERAVIRTILPVWQNSHDPHRPSLID